MELLTASGNATGAAKDISSSLLRREDVFRTVYVYGTFDGGGVTLEISHDNGTTWFDTGFSATTKTVQNIEFRATRIRAVAAGGGASISVTVVIL